MSLFLIPITAAIIFLETVCLDSEPENCVEWPDGESSCLFSTAKNFKVIQGEVIPMGMDRSFIPGDESRLVCWRLIREDSVTVFCDLDERGAR